jgi:O-antigen/teichoic acid export membrane protein
MRRLWTPTHLEILANASSLIATTGVTAALGFVYWFVAARGFSPSAVGFASASISAMTLLAYAGMLGLGTMLMGELPRQGSREGSLITSAVLFSALAGGVLGLLFAIFADNVSTDFRPLQASPGTIALFASGVALASASLVADQALIGLLLGGLQLGRNAVFAVVKLGALIVVSIWLQQRTGITIYATWVFGNLVSLVALTALGSARGWFHLAARPHWSALRGLRRAAIGHHGLNLALQFPVLGLPIIVTTSLTAAFNAYFYVAWMVTFSFVWVVPTALCMVLYTVSSKTPAMLRRAIRFTIGTSLAVGVLSNLVLPLIGEPILRLFGGAYAVQSGPSLRILVLAVFPLIIKDHFVSLCRIDGRLARATVITATGGVLELTGAAAGALLGGLAGLCLGWAAVMCIEAVLMASTVYRAALGRRSSASWATVDETGSTQNRTTP